MSTLTQCRLAWVLIAMTIVMAFTPIVIFAADNDKPTPSIASGGIAKQNIATALAKTREAAGRYEFEIHGAAEPIAFREQPILRWSNPERGQVYGNVFLWTRGGRPAVVGSLFQWFSPFTHMSHEFHSLSLGAVTGKYNSRDVWRTDQSGVKFVPIPHAPAVATTPVARLTQMRQLARQFNARCVDREGMTLEFRLLAQPVYRYEIEKGSGESLDGALFAFVQGTDPDAWLLLEAVQPSEQKEAAWQFGVARMTSVEISVTHNDQPIWHCDTLPFREVASTHKLPYTSFKFDKP